MKQIKIIKNWIGKNILLYIIVLAMIILLAATRSIVPQFGSYALDSILGSNPSVLPSFFDKIIQTGDTAMSKVVLLVIVMVAFQICRAVIMFLSRVVYSFASENTSRDIRNKLYEHLQKLPYSFFKTRNAGDIIQRCTTDMDVIKTFLGDEIIQFTWIIAMIFATVYQMVKIDLKFSLISLCIFPIILFVSIYYFKKTYIQFNLIDEYESEMIDVIKENVMGVQVVKAFGAQNFEFEKYTEKSDKYYKQLHEIFKVISKLYGTTSFLTALQTFIIMMVGIIFVRSGEVTVGTLVLFLAYTKLLTYPINMLARLITRLGRNFVAIDRIQEIFDQPEEEVSDKMPKINGNIEFKEVSFSYPDANVNVLKNISFQIKNGQKVAIIGQTGSGKSTVSYLLSRLFEPSSGKILINGIDISEINRKYLRNQIGFVVQEPYLFSREISENIAINADEVDISKVIHYAKIANVHDDISSFEKGYDTEVGERGTTLSGGQKQRVAIARMLINRYNVLVFDDSLSAVDNETDISIRKALSNIEDVTTITITHRITSILDSDLILVLANGEIIESGSINELKDQNGYFAAMYKSQVGEISE
ncbi:MAG: ABC transporter ATP-binding protein [Bacilli bacterium]